MSILKGIPVNWSVEEEFYSGYIRDNTLRLLQPEFPWIAAWKAVADSEMEPLQRAAAASDYRDSMNENVIAVTDRLLTLRKVPTVVKLFQTHLDLGKVEEIMQRWKPQTIFLRRRLIFSYLSLLKATHTGRWFTQDNTTVPLNLDEDDAYRYIQEVDNWYDHTFEICRDAEVPVLDVTFENTVESPSQRDCLLQFLGIDSTDKTPLPTTVRQDRRTDSSLVDTLRSFGSLSSELQSELLRLPGPQLR